MLKDFLFRNIFILQRDGVKMYISNLKNNYFDILWEEVQLAIIY